MTAKVLENFADTRKKMSIHLSEDRLKLFLNVEPLPKSTHFTVDEITTALKQMAPNAHFEQLVLTDIVKTLNRSEKCEERRVAKGKSPVTGRDGKLVWLVRRFGDRHFGDKEDGTAEKQSFIGMRMFENVKPEQPIVRVYRPSSGEDGVDALGLPIPSKPGNPIPVNLDASVELRQQPEEHFDLVISKLSGYVLEQSGKIIVKDVLEIPGDLDHHIGHIDFIGSVSIRGSVHKSFTVKARGAIDISGGVEGENILTAGGDLTITEQLFGGAQGAVVCSGKFKAGVVRQANFDVDGSITILKELIDSKVRCRSYIDAREAVIIGGDLRVVQGLECKALGNTAGVATRVILSNDITASLPYLELEQRLKKHAEAIELIKMHLGPFAYAGNRIAFVKGPKREQLEKLHAKLVELESSQARLKLDRQKLLEKATTGICSVNILQVMYEGASIVCGDLKFEPKADLKGPLTVEYNPDNNTLDQVAFKECSWAVKKK